MIKPTQQKKLTDLLHALIDQKAAKTIIPANHPAPGFWFGGGNMIELEGKLYVCGRFRNYGDSRVGTSAGDRGLELAIFKSSDAGQNFEKIKSFSKSDLDYGNLTVKSIEGTYLHWTGTNVELYISSEKTGIPYPEGLRSHLKPGTGVWTIDRITAPSVEELNPAGIEQIIRGDDPQYLHIKDPFGYTFANGDFAMLFCTHPYSWSSSNTAYISRGKDSEEFGSPDYTFFPRGTTWDVAITRGTAFMRVPKVGLFEEAPDTTVIFYDGGESLRNLDEHKNAVARPRGYSCEEIGGAAYFTEDNLSDTTRISRDLPLFISPYGLGTSRYVDVLTTEKGLYATWQQSQEDGSQPLVMHFLPIDQVKIILS